MNAVAASSSPIGPTRARAWIGAARLRTLPAAVAPVVLGSACAHAAGSLVLGTAGLCVLGALFLQIGTNFANDAFDADHGADADRVGPPRAVSLGWITRRQMLWATATAMAAATACGVGLALIAGWPIIALGVLSIAAGLAYTGGPWPLGYHGLGDVFVFVFFGLVAVAGTTYAQTGAVTHLALVAGASTGALATAILVVNNLRDRVGDAAVGKRTLAVRWGRRGALVEYAGLLAITAAGTIACAWLVRAPWPALALLALLPGLALWRGLAQLSATQPADADGDRKRAVGMAFNRALARTAALMLLHALALAATVVASV